ncbi:MAG: VWA domain-containing protein [Clostridia bacterium]|nr:VWA domain-containing protein [Clostridia bacterium]
MNLKRITAVILTFVMMFTCIPLTVHNMDANAAAVKRYTVLVLDTSNESSFSDSDGNTFYTAPTAIEYVKLSATRFLSNISRSTDDNFVAIVSFKDNAQIVSGFSDDYEALKENIVDLYASSDVRDISAGLAEAQSLISEINDADADKNVVLFTTGMTNNGEYNYDGVFNEDTIGSDWYKINTGIYLYAYANHAFEVAEEIKEAGTTLYTIGLFQTMEDIPELGQSVAKLFQLTTRQLASSDDCYFPVDDPDKLELTFGEIADVINKISTVTGELGDYVTVVIFNSDEYYDAVEINNKKYKLAKDSSVTEKWVKSNKGRYVKAVLANDEVLSIVAYLTTNIDNNAFSHNKNSFFSRFFSGELQYALTPNGEIVLQERQSDGTYKTLSIKEKEKREKELKYEISDDKFKELLDWCSEFYNGVNKNQFNQKLLKKKRNESWGGSCFGVSTTMALSFKGAVNLSDIFGAGETYFQLDTVNWPVNNQDFRDLINYYQLAQYVNAWQHYDLTDKGGLIQQNQETKNRVISAMIDYALQCDATGEPFVICMSYSHDSDPNQNGNTTRESAGHAIVGVGVVSTNENATVIRIVDPNYRQYNNMTLSKDDATDNYSISFELNYTADRNYDFDSINFVSLEELRVVDYHGDLYSERYNIPTSTFIFGVNEEITIIDKDTGHRFVYRKGETSGNMTVYDFYRYYSDTEASEGGEIGFELELGDNYEIITDGEIDLTIGNAEGFAGIDVVNGNHIDLDLEKGFEITGDNIQYDIFVDLDNSENLINVSGCGREKIYVEETDSSVVVTGDDLYIDSCDYLYNEKIIENEIDSDGREFEFGIVEDHVGVLRKIAINPAVLTVSSTGSEPGEEIVLAVSISDNPGINTFSLGFDYDESVLQLTNVESVSDLGGQFTYSKKAVWLNSSDTDYNGDILKLYFKVLPEAVSGDAKVTLTYNAGDISNYNEDDIFFEVQPGVVSIQEKQTIPVTTEAPTTEAPTTEAPTTEAPTSEPAWTEIGPVGDVNQDGKINSMDARLTLRFAAKQQTASGMEKLLADANGDKLVQAKDARLILRYAAKLDKAGENGNIILSTIRKADNGETDPSAGSEPETTSTEPSQAPTTAPATQMTTEPVPEKPAVYSEITPEDKASIKELAFDMWLFNPYLTEEYVNDESDAFSFDSTADNAMSQAMILLNPNTYALFNRYYSDSADELYDFADPSERFDMCVRMSGENVDNLLRDLFGIEPDHDIDNEICYYKDGNYYMSVSLEGTDSFDFFEIDDISKNQDNSFDITLHLYSVDPGAGNVRDEHVEFNIRAGMIESSGQRNLRIEKLQFYKTKEEKSTPDVSDNYHTRYKGREYHIPQIARQGSNFERINREIYEKYYTNGAESALSNLEIGIDPSVVYINYEWTVFDSILSLCVYSQTDAASARFYDVYNVGEMRGDACADSYVMSLFDLSEDEFYKATKSAMEKKFYDEYGEKPFSDDFADIWNGALKDTLADENVQKVVPHINSDNELCAIAYIYSIGGAEGYYYDINISEIISSDLHDDVQEAETHKKPGFNLIRYEDALLGNREYKLNEIGLLQEIDFYANEDIGSYTITFVYDSEGRLLEAKNSKDDFHEGVVHTCKYDITGRLIQEGIPGPSESWIVKSYTYNAEGQRDREMWEYSFGEMTEYNFTKNYYHIYSEGEEENITDTLVLEDGEQSTEALNETFDAKGRMLRGYYYDGIFCSFNYHETEPLSLRDVIVAEDGVEIPPDSEVLFYDNAGLLVATLPVGQIDPPIQKDVDGTILGIGDNITMYNILPSISTENFIEPTNKDFEELGTEFSYESLLADLNLTWTGYAYSPYSYIINYDHAETTSATVRERLFFITYSMPYIRYFGEPERVTYPENDDPFDYLPGSFHVYLKYSEEKISWLAKNFLNTESFSPNDFIGDISYCAYKDGYFYFIDEGYDMECDLMSKISSIEKLDDGRYSMQIEYMINDSGNQSPASGNGTLVAALKLIDGKRVWSIYSYKAEIIPL